jgi:hypothetical protein
MPDMCVCLMDFLILMEIYQNFKLPVEYKIDFITYFSYRTAHFVSTFSGITLVLYASCASLYVHIT